MTKKATSPVGYWWMRDANGELAVVHVAPHWSATHRAAGHYIVFKIGDEREEDYANIKPHLVCRAEPPKHIVYRVEPAK